MTRKKFRIKKKPTKPRRASYKGITKSHEILGSYDSRTVGDLVKVLQDYKEDSTIEVELDYGGCYHQSDEPSAVLKVSYVYNADDLYDQAVIQYQQKLSKYNEWYTENKDALKEEMDLRATEETKKSLRKATRLEAQAAKLRKHA